MTVWGGVFIGISASGGLGDNHPGQWAPFWREACQAGRPYACPYLADLSLQYCDRGSGWGCNEAGLLHVALARSGEDLRRSNLADAAAPFRKGCSVGFAAACRNLDELSRGGNAFSAPPPGLADYPVILQGSKGPLRETDAAALLPLACAQGWKAACAAEPRF